MAKVFVSFLGAGDYREIRYQGTTRKTRFFQAAVLEKHGTNFFDRIRIIATEISFNKHWDSLRKEILLWSEEPRVKAVLISDNLQKDQWNWFTAVLDLIDEGDDVWFDMTHGYRAFFIILSAAVGFIQKAKDITLNAVYYGADQADGHPIVNMKDFYIISEWADSVGRLTDDADAGKLGRLAQTSEIDALKELGDPSLVNAFHDMTDCIRNVDINNISDKVTQALHKVRTHKEKASGASRLLLDLVWNKFSRLAEAVPASGYYDEPYFRMQIIIIRILLDHKLYMQAFTAMRECIGSIGMIALPEKYKAKMKSSDGKRYRRRFAETAVAMFRYEESRWDFCNQGELKRNTEEVLRPWYLHLEKKGIVAKLRCFTGDLVKTRNGFDHAWTSADCDNADIQGQGRMYLTHLEETVGLLVENKMFSLKP